MGSNETLSKIFDAINKLVAVLVLLAYVAYALDTIWEIFTNPTIDAIISYFMYYGPLIVCALVLLEFGAKRNIIIQLLIYIMIGITVAFQFFPSTFNSIVKTLNAIGIL